MISLTAFTFMKLVMLYSDTRLRLSDNNTTFAGRVEVFSHGVWGRVSHSFGRPWRKKEASVVCRQLGFPGAITALSYSSFGEGSGPVVMSDVECVGTEKTLQQCQYEDWVNSYTYRGYSVGVVCKTHDFHSDALPIRLQGSPLPNTGRIEVMYAGVWGAIGGRDWDLNDAMVVCKQLNYQAGAEAALKNGVYGPFFGPIWLSNLQCNGTEKNVMKCARYDIANKTELQRPESFASVICKDGVIPSDYELRLRLQGSTVSHAGRLDLQINELWGTISVESYQSSNQIQPETTRVICRHLGFTDGVLAVGSSAFGRLESGPQWFRSYDLQCSGSEKNIKDCINYTIPQLRRYTYDDLVVVCKPNVSQTNDFQVRLTGSNLSFAGTVEVLHYGIWGGILSSFLDIRVGHVICRQMGYSGADHLFTHPAFGHVSGPLWIERIRCNGNESEISKCVLTTFEKRGFYPSFYKHYAAAVLCSGTHYKNPKDFSVRLAGAPISNAGRVEVFYAGVWGSIATWSGGWDINNGHVVCRQLGYPGAISSGSSNQFGLGTGPRWFTDIKCLGNESNFGECPKALYGVLWRYRVGTVLCKLKFQSDTIKSCSDVKCASNGTCINTAAGAVCNITHGFTGGFDPCGSSPCKNNSRCYSSGSSYLCTCPKGLTGTHCEERIIVIVKSTPLKEEAVSDMYFPITVSILAVIIVGLVATVVCLIYKKGRNEQPQNPSTVLNNEAFRADYVNDPAEPPSTSRSDADGVGSSDRLGEIVMASTPVYHNVPLTRPPTQQQTRDQMLRDPAEPTKDSNYATTTEQVSVHLMALSGRCESSVRPNTSEANMYMSLLPGRPEPGVYSELTSKRPMAPRAEQPEKKEEKKKESHAIYVNVKT